MALNLAPEELSIEVSPLSIHIGAEISGVDLARTLSSQQVADIRDTLVKWKVVFFRNQFLDHEQHIAFGRQFDGAYPIASCA